MTVSQRHFTNILSLVGLTTTISLISPVISWAGFVDIQPRDPLAKSVAEIEMPVSVEGLAKCTGTFIREDVLLTETHCISGEDRVHRIVVGPGPGYEGRQIFLSRKIVLPKRFTKPSPALIFLQPLKGETLEMRQALIKPLPVLMNTSFSWSTNQQMLVLGYGKRDGDGRLRGHTRVGTRGNWWNTELIVSPRLPESYLVAGDSGGPALVETEEGWKLWGTTWAIQVGYDLFMHVARYQNWISSTLAREPRLPK